MNLYHVLAVVLLVTACRCSAEQNDSQVLISSNATDGLKASRFCPWDFQYISTAGGCYKVVLEPLNWHQHQKHCSHIDPRAHLAVITNARQNEAVVSYLKSFSSADTTPCRMRDWYNHLSFYTSGQRIDPNQCSGFIWKPNFGHSVPLSYTNWNPGQPNCNGAPSPGNKESCLQYSSGHNYKWNDIDCSWSGCAICQIDVPL